VRRYLSGLTWDGEPRIVRVATHLFGIDRPEPLQQRILRRWFISAVARAMQPGSKVDTALVLVGPQGYRKSSFFATLGGEWFNDSHMDITTKDGILQLHAAWIYEWAEIENVTTKKQAAEVKAFITCATDAVRPPFGRTVVNQPRSSVIVGTTNEEQFLDDPTGSRRFWILRIEKPIAIDQLREWRDSLWAEAVAAHAAGEPWWLDADDDAAREKSADQHRIDDPWEEPIRAWLHQYLADPSHRDAEITSYTLLTKALHLDAVHQHANAMARTGKCMRRLGYTSERKGVGEGKSIRVWRKAPFGQQDGQHQW
jgi:predicted P-loop ATPase